MRPIDADELNRSMYHEAFESDASYDERNPMARWDGGLWIRYKMFENVIADAPTIDRQQGEWIPCSERLPEEEGYYLITLDFEWGREIEIGLWTDGEWFNDNRHANIAWMPMIEPWKGADDEQLRSILHRSDSDVHYQYNRASTTVAVKRGRSRR